MDQVFPVSDNILSPLQSETHRQTATKGKYAPVDADGDDTIQLRL
jgi:hypothetical protein